MRSRLLYTITEVEYMSEELKALEEMLEMRHLHTAMRKEEDLELARKEAEETEQENDLHPMVLSPTRSNPALIYVHPQRFLNELEKLGQVLNLQTLQFENKKTAPAPTPPAAPKEEDKPADDEVPGLKTLDTYTKEELEIKSKVDLVKIAAIDPDVNTKGVKAELIKKLTGRPKFPLE